MLVTEQLTKRIFQDAQRLKKESQELHHACRNTRSVSLLLRNVAQEERKSRLSRTLDTLFDSNNPPKGTA
jgi:sugar diacid utilization regulator